MNDYSINSQCRIKISSMNHYINHFPDMCSVRKKKPLHQYECEYSPKSNTFPCILLKSRKHSVACQAHPALVKQ